MDVLEEKVNGGPSMEIDEVVSVRDRQSCLTQLLFYARDLITCCLLQMMHSLPNICRIWATMLRTSKSLHGSWMVGRSWIRSWPAQTSNAVDINGTWHSVFLNGRPYWYNVRRILLFPFGNSNAPPNDTVSVYLDYAEPKKAPEGWHACAQFALVISNVHDPTVFTVSRKPGITVNM